MAQKISRLAKFLCGRGIKWVSFESTICRTVTEEGDKRRFATIVEPHLGEALTLARWLTGSRTDAQDVVQEACLRAFRASVAMAAAVPSHGF